MRLAHFEEKAFVDAIENVNELLNRFMKLLDTADKLLSTNGKKLGKVLTPAKIEQFMKTFQEKVFEMFS